MVLGAFAPVLLALVSVLALLLAGCGKTDTASYRVPKEKDAELPSSMTRPAATAPTNSSPYGYSQAQAQAILTNVIELRAWVPAASTDDLVALSPDQFSAAVDTAAAAVESAFGVADTQSPG